MKQIITLNIALLLTSTFSYSQGIEGVSMGSSYLNDIYYSLTDGIIASPNRADWELSFSTNAYNPNIRINSGNAVSLYEVSSDITEWDNITSLASSAIQLRNSNTDWDMGAFLANASEENYGWGQYNFVTHVIEGSKIFIISYGAAQKKMIINSLSQGNYTFTIANMDGSEEEEIVVDAANYPDKNFIYYSLQTSQIIDREPNSNNWDLLFTKYEADLNNDISDPLSYEMAYTVMGVLTNGNLNAQYEGSIEDSPSMMSLDTVRNTNTIGWDWKEYSGSYSMVPDRTYYIANLNEDAVYKIVFQSFAGATSGNMSFSINQTESLDPMSVFSSVINEIVLYPNPSKGNFYLELDNSDEAFVNISDICGQIIFSQMVTQSTFIDLTDYPSGFYFVNILGEGINTTKKVSINK
tara:strand:+ start:181 stop:1410 length:1230 start_codon:yes stop_codon:yes gene_type:complete